MLDENDIVDVLEDVLRGGGDRVSPGRQGLWGFHVREPYHKPWTSLSSGRPFLSEHEVRRRLAGTDRSEIRIPRSAILSPLAEDWLLMKGIKIIRE
ncbi:MAG TPA: hypothetical protein PK876_05660 [Elusimicrobiota bacterium]|nr:hypothetical protein [Elusimicrobiota bacterium]